MAGWKHRARVVELDAHLVALPYHQERGVLVPVAMGEVEHAVADAQRFAAGMQVAQADRQVRHRPVGYDLERGDRRAKYLDRRFERRGVENERARVVFPLIAGLIVSAAERNPLTCAAADRLRRAYGARCECCRFL